MSARSTVRYDGPRTGFRDAEPTVNCTPKPANALNFVVCVTATGTPDCSVTSVVTVQSLAIAPSTPCSCRARLAPAGRSHTTPSRKLASGVPVLATPGRSLPMALNMNEPVGYGGWTTFNRSHRQSPPIFSVWRPPSHVRGSAPPETPLRETHAVFCGEHGRRAAP